MHRKFQHYQNTIGGIIINKQPYTYTVLRYVHDTTTGEFANVGMVLLCVQGFAMQMPL